MVADAFGAVENALPSTLGGDPLLVVGIAVVVVVVLAGGGVLLRRLLRTSGQEFARALRPFDSVAVLMHPEPDPDAMASALAAQQIADYVDTETTLYYSGQIRHPENRAFETVLETEFERIDNAGEIAEENIVLVDHNEPRGFSGAQQIDPEAVVDHHPGDGTGSQFTDVRVDTGACATIFSEYFREIGLNPVDPEAFESGDDDGVIPPDVATGMVYGIQSDTKHLTKGCSRAEFDAAAYLYDGIDEDKLDRIANPEMDAEVLETKAEAIQIRDVRNAFAVSNVGELSNLDAIPVAADELSQLEGVTAVVVLGEKDGEIQLSGRSRDDRVHMGKTLQTVVEDVPMASAGGHARMGGGSLSVDHMQGIGPGEGLTRDDLEERLFDAMRGDI